MQRIVSVVTVLAFTAPFSLALPPAGNNLCLVGNSVDTSGAAVAGATITAQPLRGNAGYSARSDSSGRFSICGLEPADYRVEAQKAGFQERELVETPGADTRSPFTFTLERESAKAQQSPLTGSADSRDLSDNGVGGVGFFRASGGDAVAQQMPEAPSPVTGRPHGQVKWIFGSTGVNAPDDAAVRGELPVSELRGSVGGEIGHNRAGYFTNFDQFNFSRQRLMSFLGTLQARTGDGELPIGANPASSGAYSAGLDHSFGQRDSAYARFNRDDLHSYSLQPDRAAPPSLETDLHLTQDRATVGNTAAISPSTVDAAKAQFISTDLRLPPGAPEIGIESPLPTARRDRIFEAANNVYRQVGAQSLRMGGDFLFNRMNISFLESSLGRATSGNPSFSQSGSDAELYAQSERRVRSNVLLTSGVSYNVEVLKGFATDTNNLAPQVGVAWSPAQGTVIRGGAGVYYDQIPLPAIAGPVNTGGVANLQSSGRFTSGNGFAADRLAGFTLTSPSIQNSYAEQADAQVEQQIGAKGVLSAETQYVRGVQLALPVLRPAAMCQSSSACRAGNTFWGQEIGTGGVSTYSGTSASFTEEPVRWGSYRVSYSYATARGSGVGENGSYVSDLMRRASFTATLHSSLDSGADLWQHLTNGFALAATGDYATETEFAGINFFKFNGRLTKTLAWGNGFHLDAVAETFNTLARTSAALARSASEMGDGFAGVYSAYQRVASMQSPNATQAGLRLSF